LESGGACTRCESSVAVSFSPLRFPPSLSFAIKLQLTCFYVSPYSIDNNGSKFTVQTNKDAPNWKVQTFDLNADQISFETIIEEDSKAVLGSVSPIREDLLVVTYCRDVSLISYFSPFAKASEVASLRIKTNSRLRFFLLQVNDELYLYSNEGKRIVRLAPNYVGSIGSISGKKEHERFFVSTCELQSRLLLALSLTVADRPICSSPESQLDTPILDPSRSSISPRTSNLRVLISSFSSRRR